MPTDLAIPGDDEPPLLASESLPIAAGLAVAEAIAPVVPAARRGMRRWRTTPTVGAPGAFSAGAWRRGLQLPNALQDAPYRRWWTAQMVALFAMWGQSIAAQLVILSITSSAFLIGALNVVAATPLLMLSLIGGVLADKFDRRRILIATQTCVVVLSLGWAVLILTDQMSYAWLLMLVACGGTIASFDFPAGQAFLAQIVRRENLPEAVALNSASVNATRAVGPLVGGILIGAFGLAAAFVTHSLAVMVFVLAIVSLGRMIPKTAAPAHGERPLAALRIGLTYIRRSDELLGLVGTTALMSFLAVPGLLVLMPLYVTETLGGGNRWVPISTSIFGLGSLLAAIVMFRASKSDAASGLRLRVTGLTLAAGLLWLALSPNPWVAAPGILLSGCSFELGLIQIQTRLQQLAPDHMRGRVLSVNGLAFNGVMPASTLSISTLASSYGQHVVLAGCAAAMLVGSVLIWRRYTWKAFAPGSTPF
jgi:MFS family permease